MPAMTCALVERLETIADPRRQSENLKHPLVDIIILGFCGVLAGCDDFVEIAEWAKVQEVFFRSFLELPHGIPAHDTFTRVFAMLKPAPLQEVLLPWLLERRGLPGDWIHLDGKTMRQTRCPTAQLKALLDCCVLGRREEWSHGCPRLLFGKDFSEDCCGRLPTLQQLMSVHDQFLDQRLALLSTRLPNGLDWVGKGSPFSR
jgi:hypothetical protein